MKTKEMEQELDRGTGQEAENEEQGKETENGGETEAAKQDPADLLRELCRGTLTLIQPFRAHSDDVLAVPFDFCGLTGTELMDAMDNAGGGGSGMFGLTNRQAMALFAKTAEKCAPMVKDGNRMTRMYDAKDVMSRMGAADSVTAVQLAKLFYRASSQAGNNNISKE